ncbi:MAG: hypothetical protein ABSB67_12890 [Bryobacteraceae bacterium]|jgi:hypothetical protein
MENTQTAGAGSAPPKQYPVIDGLCEELKQFLRALEPSPEVTGHFRNARIEMLKGFRQLIDNRIEHLSRPAQTGQKITVE